MRVMRGLVAGAAGVTALNAATHLDMAVRARPASDTPERSVRRMADLAHIDLGHGERADNRVTGLGALLGAVVGISAAVGYTVLAPGRAPWPVAAAALTGVALIVGNGPMTALGITDPRSWSARDWAADVAPHIAYGVAAATALRLSDREK